MITLSLNIILQAGMRGKTDTISSEGNVVELFL
jgi:hypothetical protein